MADQDKDEAKSADEAATEPHEKAREEDHPPRDGEGSAFFAQHEARPTGENYRQSAEEEKSRKRRSLAIGLGLLAFVVLIYFITMLKLSANI